MLIQISSIKKPNEIPPSKQTRVSLNHLPIHWVFWDISIRLQDFERDANLGFLYDILGQDYFDIVRFHYLPGPEFERASMTFI
ncbi:MAG: hypothetical protein R2784_09060 [Saprospiraceae bacterium]